MSLVRSRSLDPAELGFERVLADARTSSVWTTWSELRSARAVGRLVIRSGSSIVGFGTGSLIAPRVLVSNVTNNQVLGNAEEAGASLIEFNFRCTASTD